MKKYLVGFYYSFVMEADNEQEAERKAIEIFIDDDPKVADMAIDVEEQNE